MKSIPEEPSTFPRVALPAGLPALVCPAESARDLPDYDSVYCPMDDWTRSANGL